jgi:hypothetical protein
MVIVAVAALAIATAIVVQRRRERFTALAADHGAASAVVLGTSGPLPSSMELRVAQAVAHWHWNMQQKYLRAARYPWLPVPPDPRPPK